MNHDRYEQLREIAFNARSAGKVTRPLGTEASDLLIAILQKLEELEARIETLEGER